MAPAASIHLVVWQQNINHRLVVFSMEKLARLADEIFALRDMASYLQIVIF